MELIFKNTRIHYTTEGSGKPVVLLHGFLESAKIWDEFIPGFTQYAQIITIDLPGHGRSGCLGEVHTMEAMAGNVHAILSHLRIQKANFIGHSMGGYVALAFLDAFPTMVNHLLLLNSTPAADTPERRETRDRSIDLVRKNKEAYIRMAISNLLNPGNKARFEKEIEDLKNNAMQFPTKGITANLEGMKIRTDRTDVLRKFPGGKTIVAGKQDPVMDYLKTKSLAEEANCTFITFPDGHLSYLENKEEFIKLCISSKK